jgi:O-antigen/teichoic acid export membrane protein
VSSIRSTVIAVCSPSVRRMLSRIEGSPVGSRLARSFGWSLTGAVAYRGLMLSASVLVARMLGQHTFGELGLIQSTLAMFGTFAGFGLGLTATKHVAEFRKSDPARTGRIIRLSGMVAAVSGGLIAVAIVLLADRLAKTAFKAPGLASALRVGAIVTFFEALNVAQMGALSGFEAFKAIARINVGMGFLSVALLVTGSLIGGLQGALWALVLNAGCSWFAFHLTLRRVARHHGIPLGPGHHRSERAMLWRFSLPALMCGVMWAPATWICNALLVNQPDGYAQMGILAAAGQWLTVILFIPTVVSQVILPVYASQLGSNDRRAPMRLMVLAVKANLAVAVPLALMAACASETIMSFYGKSFSGGWPTLVAVLIGGCLTAVQAPIEGIIDASGQMWLKVGITAIRCIVFVSTTMALVYLGAFGVAMSAVVSYIVHVAIVLAIASRLLRGQDPATPIAALPHQNTVSGELQ